jgi:3-deoxy-D-arabino-heptulosonate 7-phosphate (DAHP) synthase
LHVKEIVPLLSPRALKALSPTPEAVNAVVAQSRERVIRILPGRPAPARRHRAVLDSR